MKEKLTQEEIDAIDYELSIQEFFKKNYAMLLATFLEQQHDEFMLHVEDMFEDHEGKQMNWQWSDD